MRAEERCVAMSFGKPGGLDPMLDVIAGSLKALTNDQHIYLHAALAFKLTHARAMELPLEMREALRAAISDVLSHQPELAGRSQPYVLAHEANGQAVYLTWERRLSEEEIAAVAAECGGDSVWVVRDLLPRDPWPVRVKLGPSCADMLSRAQDGLPYF